MKLLQKIFNSKSQTFVYLLVWFILGVTLASALGLKREVLFQLYLGLIMLIVALILFWNKKQIRLIVLGGIFLFLGLGRFVFSEPPIDSHHLRFYNGRLVEMVGVIIEESEEKNGKQTVVVKSERLKIVNEYVIPTKPPERGRVEGSAAKNDRIVKGKTILYLPVYPQYNYGDQLKITCELAEPKKNQDFDYPAYLARQGIWSICLNSQIEKIGSGQGNWLMKLVFKVKTSLIGRVNQILPEPQASFLGGLLYGARSSIPEELKIAFNRTGTTHIIAISGYNITIIAASLLALLKGLWIPRKKAFWLTVAGLIFFILLTGASASVVRAGLMGLIVLLARQLGRLSQVGRILILVAFLMLLANPRILFFDAGFQLSFASTLGLIYLLPVMEKAFSRLPLFFGLKEAFLTTLSAIVATLPLILYQFGRFSIVAPLTNLLILFVIPLTMALGFGAIILSFIFLPLGQVAGWLVWLPLTYIIKIVEFFSDLPWSSLVVPKMPWWGMAGMYVGLVFIIYKLRSKKSNKIPNDQLSIPNQ